MSTDTAQDTAAEAADVAEIRTLGRLRVRRADGSDVHPSAWRTRKTVDLLLLLAVNAGRPVPVARIVEHLWPDVPEARGRASLRTAASTIRQVLGAAHVERREGGLELREVWVDSVAFATLAREVRSCERESMPARVVAAARAAEALYLDDLVVDDSGRVGDEGAALRETYRYVLEAAADAALALGWDRDAAAFATRAVALDGCAERPVRALMTASARLGRLEQSLRAFQHCRRALADELGVDPSPQTAALHVRVLTGQVAPAPLPRPRFLCRDLQLQQAVVALSDARSGEHPTVLELRGEDGCGRRRLLDEACGLLASTWEQADDLAAGGRPGAVRFVEPSVLARLARAPVCTDDPGGPGRARQDSGAAGPAVVTGDLSTEVRDVLVGRGWSWHEVSLPRWSPEEAATLLAEVLGGAVSTHLVDDVLARSDGTVASVVTTARADLRSGRVRSTIDGVTLVPLDDVHDIDAQTVLTTALEQLSPEALEVMHVLALLDAPISLDALMPALPDGATRPHVRRSLDRLVDMELVTTTRSGYHFRHPLVASAVRAWVRPSVRRSLHGRIAERAVLPATMRIQHWLDAGEPRLACAAAIDASKVALARDCPVEARDCLLQARAMSTMLGADPADQAELGEQLGDVCVRLGRLDEAADVYAFALREAVGLPTAREDALRSRYDAAVRGRTVVTPPPVRRDRPVRSWTVPRLARDLGLPADGGDRSRTEELLRTALDEAMGSSATDAGDRAAGIRILLVDRVLLPRRQLTRAKEVLAPVRTSTSRPDLVGRAAVSQWLPDVLLGDACPATKALTATMAAVGDPRASARLRVVQLLAAHDLGTLSSDPSDDPDARGAGSWWRWLPLRILSEAGRPDEAQAWRRGGEPSPDPLLRQLEALATVELHEAGGRPDDAVALLGAAAEDAVATGTVLLLPEIAARLVILGCGLDQHRAQDDFDLMDWALGGEPAHPREIYFRLLARAHVRAQSGQPERAAVAASSARSVAAGHGLVVLQDRAAQVERALHAMEQRRRASDRAGELWRPVQQGATERRTRFPRVRPVAPRVDPHRVSRPTVLDHS